MKRVFLITGASGFVGGSFLSLSRLTDQADVVLIGRNEIFVNGLLVQKNNGTLQELLSEADCIFVLHFATKYVKSNEEFRINEVVNSNVVFGLNLLEALNDWSVDYVFLNFCSAFQSDEYSSYSPTIYTKTKNIFKDILDLYGNININIYLYDTFGFGDKRKKLLPYMNDCLRTGEEFHVASLTQELALTDISVIIDGIDYVIENYPNINKDICLHQSELISIQSIIDIARKFGDFKMIKKDNYSNDVQFRLGELPKGFTPTKSLSNSLQEYFSRCA